MPKRNSKGQFQKSHTRSAGGGKGRSSTALTVRETVVVAAPQRRRSSSKKRHHKTAHHAKRRGHKGGRYGGLKLTHVALAAAGLAYLTGDASPIQAIPQNIAKVPGAKTFGNTTMAGLVCLGVDRWLKPNRWLRLAGVAGVVAGALQVGSKGTDFKWLGDAGDEYTGDVVDDITG